MKVLYILHSRSLDGSYLAWADMVLSLSKQGVQPFVICENSLFLSNHYQELQKSCSIVTKVLPIYLSIKPIPPENIIQRVIWIRKWVTAFWGKFCFFRKVLKFARIVKPDVIHTNSGVVHEGCLVALYMRIPHLWHLREYQNLGFNCWIHPTKGVFEKLLRKSSVVGVTQDILAYFHLLNHQSAYIVHDGVYHIGECEYTGNKRHYFLCASRLHYQKHIDDAIRAFALFVKTNSSYTLLLAGEGDGDYVQFLRNLTVSLGIGAKVIFLGFCNKTTIKSLMQYAKAVVVPSVYEGFGLMSAEAIFNGTIVIGRAIGGTAEIIAEAGGVGYMGDYTELAYKMQEVAALSDDDYCSITIKAKKRAEDLFSIERNSSLIITIYKRIIGLN